MRRILSPIAAVLLILALALQAQPTGSAARAHQPPATCPISLFPVHGPAVAVSIPLLVVLEWNAQNTTACAQWRSAMERASGFLEQATGGQMALGEVRILDNAQQWTRADIQVHVQNTGFPDATVGGIDPVTVGALGGNPGSASLTPSSTLSSGGVFARGAIHLGRSWSEFGPRRGRWSDPDGYRTIVHELGHFAFYLYDEYFGYSDAGGTSDPGAARAPAACTHPLFDPGADVANPLTPDQPNGASIMYWEYTLGQYWSGTPSPVAAPGCASGRQWQVYHAPDWSVIASHYPAVAPGGTAPAPAPYVACTACITPGLNRWLLDLSIADNAVHPVTGQSPACPPTLGKIARTRGIGGVPTCLQADGYLVKAGAASTLHEGTPYRAIPPGIHEIPTQGSEAILAGILYPPDRLDVLGGDAGDTVRVTMTDPAHPLSGLVQAVQPLGGPMGAVIPPISVPNWYANPLPAVPQIAVQPVVTGSGGSASLAGIRVTAANPLDIPLRVAAEAGRIDARLFESGQGRQAATTLVQAASSVVGHEYYTGDMGFADGNPILEGSFYITPSKGERAHEEPNVPGGGAWAMATYSLSCNSPSYFFVEHAPGDEGGIDSADGVVNVHLPAGSDDPSLCVGFTGQAAPPADNGLALVQNYAVVGSTPLPTGTVITFHFDRDALIGHSAGTLAIVRRPLPSKLPNGRAPAACQVVIGYNADLTDGTVSAIVGDSGSGSGDAAYQLTLLPPGSKLPACVPR